MYGDDAAHPIADHPSRPLQHALHSADFGDKAGDAGHGIALPFTFRGYLVTRVRPRKPYGYSTARNSHLVHAPMGIAVAWRGGQPEGRIVEWRCGARTPYFRLGDDLTLPLCPRCWPEETG